jgi:hypothetical protein
MPHGSAHLNDKQIRVLRWVAEGAPGDRYEPGDYAHRITAKALASLGLLRITGSGKSWAASLTAAGKARVAELPPEQSDDASDQDEDEAVRLLISRLDEAAGSLTVEGPDEQGDYEALVLAANKSAHRPRGKQLHAQRKHWSRPFPVVISYRDWFWDLAEEPSVAAVGPGSRLSPIAKIFLASKNDQFVTKDVAARAARVLEAIVRHATNAGLAVRDPRPVDERKQRQGERTATWSGHLEIDVSGSAIRVQIREIPGRGGKKFDFYGADSEFDRKLHDQIMRLPGWQRSRNYWFVPTGKLEVRLAEPGSSFEYLKWGDAKTRLVEDRLGEVFRYIEVKRLEREAAKRHAKEAEERKERDWKTAMAQARASFRASQEEALLMEQASKWSRQRKVNAFIEELRRRGATGEALGNEWITIGERVAQRLDPFVALAEPAFPQPSAQDLEPFLNGWSGYGPYRKSS